MCRGVSLFLTVAVQLLLGHRSAQPEKFTPYAHGKTTEWQTNRARFTDMGGVHTPVDKPHCLFYKDFGDAEKNNNNTCFVLYLF